MQPRPETVPMAAVTAPSSCLKRLVSTITLPTSATALVTPLSVYAIRKTAGAASPMPPAAPSAAGSRSGVRPKRSVVTADRPRPHAMAPPREPYHSMSCGAKTALTDMPSG